MHIYILFLVNLSDIVKHAVNPDTYQWSIAYITFLGAVEDLALTRWWRRLWFLTHDFFNNLRGQKYYSFIY